MKMSCGLVQTMKSKHRYALKKGVVCFFSFSLLFSGQFFADPVQAKARYSSSNRQSSFEVPYRSTRLLHLKPDEVVIAAPEPNVAFIEQLKDGQHVLIHGMGLGSTSMVLLDKKNRISRTLNIDVTRNLNGLKKKLYQLLPNENIKVSNAEGRIILSGQVSNLVNMDTAIRLAEAFAMSGGGQQGGGQGGSSSGSSSGGRSGGNQGNVINMMQVGGGQQVMLEVKIAEVSRSLVRKLGIHHTVISKSGGATWFSSMLSTTTATAAAAITGGMSYVASDLLLNWTIDLTRETQLATLLAEPNLTTLSGQKASFLSGGEFPYSVCNQGQTDTQANYVCTVSFKRFGVGLEFLPTVLSSNKINLDTHVSVSTLNNKAAEVTGVENSTPSLAVREAQTTIELADGQSMSIAGLLSDDNTSNQTHIPGLADLPMVGGLFRNRASSSEQKELIILVTPHLAKSVPKDQISLPTDAFVQPDDVDFYLLGRMESRKVRPIQPDSSIGGVTGQFGHQLREGDK